MPVQIENTIKNRVNVETSRGDKSFFLIHGNLLLDDGDVFVVNTYENENGELIGDFAESFKDTFHIDLHHNRPIFTLKNGGHIGIIEQEWKNNSPVILVLHTKLNQGELIEKDVYNELITGMYSALASLEMSGYQFHTISLPVLLRKGLEHINSSAANILIKNSIQWLRKSAFTNAIRYYVYLEKDVEIWDAAINDALGRTVIAPGAEGELARLQKYISNLIWSFPKESIIYLDTLLPLNATLTSPSGKISPEIVAAFGRKLIESLCKELLGTDSIKLDLDLRELAARNYDPVFVQCLYQIRSFGNTSVHRATINYGLKGMEEEDLKILLLMIKKVLIYYQENIVARNK